MTSQQKEIRATAKYLRLSPLKVRRVLDQIRGKSYKEALMILQFMPYRSCKYIIKILKSAVANAEHNNKYDKLNLNITQAYADKGPILKRFQPRAQGRGYPIQKPTCHITIVVM
uniref:ribosomal protein L22 n=1 Tax=Glaucosphaera vacuolata TaxID=38265 RepID=UPI001FCD84BC|nr:ribosomal protein L22 [Glaucosphaera vacuolata]UNJ18733.1 ribosomal protein L22 [Glaucosphaera vacuolata]